MILEQIHPDLLEIAKESDIVLRIFTKRLIQFV